MTSGETPGGSAGAPEAPAATILVVDDEEFIRDFSRSALEHLGYRVLDAPTGRAAVDLYRERADEVACVILDLSMPGMDGVAVLRELRGIRGDVKVILASGLSEEEGAGRVPASEISAFLQKPYRLRHLQDVVEKTLAA